MYFQTCLDVKVTTEMTFNGSSFNLVFFTLKLMFEKYERFFQISYITQMFRIFQTNIRKEKGPRTYWESLVSNRQNFSPILDKETRRRRGKFIGKKSSSQTVVALLSTSSDTKVWVIGKYETISVHNRKIQNYKCVTEKYETITVCNRKT